MGSAALSSLTILLYLHISPTVSVLVNHTIDDMQGDEMTHALPSYSPSNLWTQGDTCDGCNINRTTVDVSRAFDKTWHDSTYHVGEPERIISMQFTGTAVYAFTLIANHIHGTTTFTNLTFYLDKMIVGEFVHEPNDSSDILYNVSVFSLSNLSNNNHKFEIHMGGPTDSLMLFDYVVYTAEEENVTPPPSSSIMSSTAAILSPDTTTTSSMAMQPPPLQRPAAGTQSSNASLGLASSPTNTTASPSMTSLGPIPSPPSTRTSPALTPIVSGTLGGFVLGVLIATAFYVVRKRCLASRASGAPEATLASPVLNSTTFTHGEDARQIEMHKPRLSTRRFKLLSEYSEPSLLARPEAAMRQISGTAASTTYYRSSTVRHTDSSAFSISSSGSSRISTAIQHSAV